MRVKNILVIGGGIGGLCTALTLQKKGFSVQLYEAAASFEPIGAGIGIGSNAVQALNEAGIGGQITAQGNSLQKLVFQNGRGQKLNELNFSLIREQFGLENITIHRAELQRILLQSMAPDTVHLHKRCVNFNQNDHQVTVFFEDGTQVTGDLLIAADGIDSIFRQKLVPGSAPRYAGYTCWRGVVDNRGRIHEKSAIEIWAREGRFGIVPLENEQVYWFACVNAQRNDPVYRKFQCADVAHLFKEFPGPVEQLIRETGDDQLLLHDILDLQPLRQFVYGRVVLLGDAAHATTPNMGQGAGQAIEDAIVLANCLSRSKKYEHALHVYEQKRVKRTGKIITMSRQIGAAAQLENRFLANIRDQLFKRVPTRFLHGRFRFLYDVDLTIR